MQMMQLHCSWVQRQASAASVQTCLILLQLQLCCCSSVQCFAVQYFGAGASFKCQRLQRQPQDVARSP